MLRGDVAELSWARNGVTRSSPKDQAAVPTEWGLAVVLPVDELSPAGERYGTNAGTNAPVRVFRRAPALPPLLQRFGCPLAITPLGAKPFQLGSILQVTAQPERHGEIVALRKSNGFTAVRTGTAIARVVNPRSGFGIDSRNPIGRGEAVIPWPGEFRL